MPSPADVLGTTSLPGLVISAFYSLMQGLSRGARPVVRFQDLGPSSQRLVSRWAARGGIQGFEVQSMMPPTGGTPPINPGGYPYPVPRGETVRGPFRNPWDPYVGLFEILVRGAKRAWKKIPKGAARRAAGRAVPGVVGVGIWIGGVLWDFLPDLPNVPTDEDVKRRRIAKGCRPHMDGWICPPGAHGTSPPRNPAALPPPAPTALPGGAPTGAPAPVVTRGPTIRTVKEPWWKKALEIATPLLPLAALLIPSGSKKAGSIASVTTVNIPSLGPSGFYRDLTGISARGASLPGSGTGQGRCECKPKRKRKPKERRKVCYRGTYTETPTGLQKRRGKRISCQRSRKKQRS